MAAWIASLGWLVFREYGGAAGGENGTPSRVMVPPTTAFYALSVGPQQVGLGSITSDTLPDGIRLTSRTDIDLPWPIVQRRLLTVTEALYDRRLRIRSFTTTVSGESGQLTLAASVAADTLLTAVVSGRGLTNHDTVRVRVPEGVLLPDAIPLAIAARGDLRPGTTASVQVIDPVDLTVSERVVRIGAESTFVMPDSAVYDSLTSAWAPSGQDTLGATSLSWIEHGVPVRAWVDRRGDVIERHTPLGPAMRRAPFEIVNSGYIRRRPRSVQAIPLELPGPDDAADQTARVSLGVADLPDVAASLTTPWQAVARGDIQTVKGPIAGRPPGAGDTVRASDRRPPSAPRLSIDARRIARSDTSDAAAAVARLVAWISSSVVPGSPTIGDPELTLIRRRGDSSNRAELFVAMARSLGIPARPVAGLLVSGGRFRYRAWAEVWLDGWVPVDPSLGQVPADPGHIRLLTRVSARQPAIVSLVGAVRPILLQPTTVP